MSKSRKVSRRKFLGNLAAGGAALTIVPRHVLGRGFTAPSDKLNIAAVGVGGMGRANLIALASQNIVALCDVDWGYADKGFDRLDANIESLRKRIDGPDPVPAPGQPPAKFNRERAKVQLENMIRLKTEHVVKAKRYKDYREMLEAQKDIDAVLVATPDHMHATIALAAMDLNKHVYVQKPLCWCIGEARRLSSKAKDTNVVTQMGNQGHSSDDGRTAVEHIWAGDIGEVREVHVWTNRPLGFWPQGVPRPTPLTVPAESLHWDGPGVNTRLAAALTGNYPVPEKLDWDLFLGVSPRVEYHPIYHPFNWRGWVDWGVGAIGDMGAHLLDHPVWSLDLGFPTSVESISTPFNNASYPDATLTFYEFPARGKMPPVKITWYDGGLKPQKPEEIGEEELKGEGGALYIGSKGKMIHDTYGLNPRLLFKSDTSSRHGIGGHNSQGGQAHVTHATGKMRDPQSKPPQKLPRIENESHELNWVNACMGKTKASCPFEYAAHLTEIMLLGVVALRAGKKILYDGANMRVTNAPQANDFLTRVYRQGW
ncbi:MAG: Gfo/Idh/MocA family oxidoreductase [Candidatus Acidiferrum sp.]